MSTDDLVDRLARFDEWIRELDEDVIQDEYGYERGEFSVYPDAWRSMFDEGITPQQAFKRALDAFAEARREDDWARQANYERILREDAALKARAARPDSEG